jgi:acetyltransferase-like isoleucine patch superfamily enzyme
MAIKKAFSTFLKCGTFLFPWFIRRVLLNKWFGYKIDRKATIGLAWVFPKELYMSAGARIDHFTVAINLDRIEMAADTIIGRSNWITGFPTDINSSHFSHQPDRKAALILKECAAITKNHHFDCTSLIYIGRFSTIAGYNSQFLTHAINLLDNRQDSAPIYIGEYTFVGTNVVVLGGSQLPNYSVLGAKSLLNKSYSKDWMLYGGVPARELKAIPSNS